MRRNKSSSREASVPALSRPTKNVCRMGLGVVAGGMMFVGQADAATIVNESFESSPSAQFGAFSSYAYSQNYTSTNTPPAAGLRYFTGDTGLAEQSKVAALDLTDAAPGGLPAAVLDAGLGAFDLSAYFSGYLSQGDFSAVRLQFMDASGAPLGPIVEIGGGDFVAALPTGPNGDGVAGYKDFGLDRETGAVPAGARSADLTIFTQRAAGAAADGYLDLLRLDVSAVPEPSTGVLCLSAAALLGLRRRRRAPSDCT